MEKPSEATRSPWPEKPLLILFFLLLPLALFLNFSRIELEAEEPRRAIVSLEMQLLGEYAVPQLHGETYYNKPPLFNWLLIGLYQLTGSADEWVVRLPSMLSFLLIGWLVYAWGRRYLPHTTALMAALAWLTTAELLFHGTNVTGEIDYFFSLLILLQAFAIFHFAQRQQWWLLFTLSYFIAALAFLTKGLPALVFQGATLLGWLISLGHWKKLFHLPHAAGILLMGSVLGAYGLAYSAQAPIFPFLLNLLMESSQRTAAESSALKTLAHLLEFPLTFSVLLLPWSLFLCYWHKGLLRQLWQNPLLKFSLAFLLANVLPYWISPGLRKPYLYMFLPFALFLLLAAVHWGQNRSAYPQWQQHLQQFLHRFWLAVPILLVGAALALPFLKMFAPIPGTYWVAGFLLVVGSWLFWQMWQNPQQRIILLMLSLLAGKIAYNAVVKPYRADYSESRVFRKHIGQVLKITEGEPVHFYASPSADINRFLGASDTLHIPPHIPYGIPYYLTKGNQAIMKMEQKPIPRQFYLSRLQYVEGLSYQTHYRFSRKDDHWVLFTVNGKP